MIFFSDQIRALGPRIQFGIVALCVAVGGAARGSSEHLQISASADKLAYAVGDSLEYIAAPSVNSHEATLALLGRILPNHADQFVVELQDLDSGQDQFKIDSRDGKIVLTGRNGVVVASALNWYLKYAVGAHLSWAGDQLALPEILPLPDSPIIKKIDAAFRVHFNYCTISYTAAWWDWEQWEREIDFLAMNGVNMPLSVVGLEAVWYETLLKFGYSDEEARQFLVGPAYFAWQWMTNIQSHGGPLPKSWIDKHRVLICTQK